MLRIHQKVLSFCIVSHKIAHNVRDYIRDPTLNFYPVVGLKDTKLGTISLNQPNNQNFLTVEMMGEVFRFLNSYHHDHTVENIWIQNRGSMFLGGLSYQELAQDPEYLDKLYKMTVMVAKLNKPMFAFASGGVRNVGAYVLSMAAVALTDYSASLRIDEVSKGFIPVAGGSHKLSRLPVNVGYFLALTGKRLTSDEMSRLGFINAVVKQGVSSEEIRTTISKSNLFFRDKIRLNRHDKRDSEWQEWTKIQQKQKRLKSETQINQLDIINSKENIFAKLAMSQYKIAQINYENVKNAYNSFSEKPGRQINNYFRMRHQKAFNRLQKNGFVEKSNFDDVRLPGFQIDKILKVFSQDSIVEVVKALEADTSDWGKQTLKHLRQMDPLAAVLTFELLKRAENLSWDQCLDLEYAVAKRLLANSKLTLKETYSGSKFVFVNKYSESKIEQIPLENVLEEYFSAAFTQEEQLEREVPLKSLLPNSEYAQIPDSARLALNQQFFDDIHIHNQNTEMQRWLQNQKIDYRHRSYDIHLLREKIHNKKEYELTQNNESKRLQFLVNNSKALRQFVEERFKLIDEMKDSDMETYLKDVTRSVFNDGIKERFEEFEKTAEIIGKEKKLQIFKNLRKTLIKRIVLNGTQIEAQYAEKHQHFQGPIYFDKGVKGIFESKNPDFEASQGLKRLETEITEKGQISPEYVQTDGGFTIERHLGIKTEPTENQKYANYINNKIAQRYLQYPHEWERAYQYHQLVNEASRTSSDLAQYLQWGPDAYYSIILNAPSAQKSYAQFGQQCLDRIQQQRNIEKSKLQTDRILFETFSQEYSSQLYNGKQVSKTHESSKFIKEQLIPKFALNKELQKFMAPLLEQVLKHFEEKYFVEALKDKKLEFGEFDKFVYEAQDKEFVEVYKNDILFVYSYFAILKVKDVLHNLKLNGVPQKPQALLSFFRQYGIEFKEDRTAHFMNRILSKFLFNMLDLHTYTKAKIRLPQTKLLDFLNRTKISRETQKKSLYPLSFESLLLMIGKDRTKLYNKILQDYIPTEPQYLLEMAHNNTKDYLNDEFTTKGNQTPSLYVMENAVSKDHLDKKSLIAAYQYYLGLFDSFIHRASGKYNFINDQTLGLDVKKLKTQMGNILNMKETPRQWFERNTLQTMKQLFNLRLQNEKNLTKGELLAFDQEWRELITPESWRLVLKYVMNNEIAQTKQYFRNVRHYEYPRNDSDINEETYCEIRRNVKNPDAFKRLNNLRLAMDVQNEYFQKYNNKPTMQEEKEDLVEEKRQFNNYERFPKQTYRRISSEPFEYGEEKNFDKYLNPIKDRQMDHKTYSRKLRFAEDQRKTNFKKQEKLTDFDEEIKTLRATLTRNSKDEQVDSIYKKLEELV